MLSFRDFFEETDVPHFNYQGSKASIRQWVLQFMPPQGRWYVEAFGGRGNMFFLARKSLDFRYWHLNDLNSQPFFQAIKDVDTDQFPQKMTQNLYNQYKANYKANKDDQMSKVLEPGITWLGHYRSGYAGNFKKAKAWDKQDYSQRVLDARESLNNVKITNLSWDALPYSKYTHQDFIYFDPPYLDTDNRYYKDIDHKQFLQTVKSLKSRWMISHTNHPLYIRYLGKPTAIKERGANLHRTAGKTLTESIWKGNY